MTDPIAAAKMLITIYGHKNWTPTGLEAQALLVARTLTKIVSVVLEDTEGDLDFVKFQVRAALKQVAAVAGGDR